MKDLKTELLALRAHFITRPDGAIILSKANKKDFVLVTKDIPAGSVFEHKGGITFANADNLPKNVKFTNQGAVSLPKVRKMDKSVVFHNKGNVTFNNRFGWAQVPPNYTFENNGEVQMLGASFIGAGGKTILGKHGVGRHVEDTSWH